MRGSATVRPVFRLMPESTMLISMASTTTCNTRPNMVGERVPVGGVDHVDVPTTQLLVCQVVSSRYRGYKEVYRVLRTSNDATKRAEVALQFQSSRHAG